MAHGKLAVSSSEWSKILNLIHAKLFSKADIDNFYLLPVRVPAASPIVPALETSTDAVFCGSEYSTSNP
jgi:hypothetical protein